MASLLSRKSTEKQKEVNILVLGESGTGKSTFINSMLNYMKHASLEEAMQETQISYLIETSFVVTDENFNQHRVTLNGLSASKADNGESHNVGESATKFPQSHVIMCKDNTVVQVIDTPGIGDPEGFKKDQENCDNIVEYISQFDELNAICILLKPNLSRLDVSFRYCFKELLIHLHKNAVANIVFCFTNTRSNDLT